MEARCCNGFLKGGLISSDPTTSTTGYPVGFVGWTAAGKAFLHMGSGNWIALNPDPPPPEENDVEK